MTPCCLFEADVSLPSLRNLELSSMVDTALNLTFADLFPRVHSVAVDVGLNLHGLKLANDWLLRCVTNVTMRCVGYGINHVCELTVPRASVLKHLTISVGDGQHVSVQVQCAGVQVLVKGEENSSVIVEVV